MVAGPAHRLTISAVIIVILVIAILHPPITTASSQWSFPYPVEVSSRVRRRIAGHGFLVDLHKDRRQPTPSHSC
jgi:hypothetical protein